MNRDALVVGINLYDHLRPLNSPSEDAEAVAQLLSQFGGVRVRRLPEVKSNGSIRVGEKTRVTQTDLENALVDLFTPSGGGNNLNTALLFFSGHGLRKDRGIQEGFLGATDTNPNSGNWGLSLQWLRRLLLESNVSQQIVWLDCCYSGELLSFQEANPGYGGNGPDWCFITASRKYEKAYEETSGNHGVLTGALLKGLDPRKQPDAIVTNYGLIDSINKILKSSRQCPFYSNSGGPIDLAWCGEGTKIVHPTPSSVCPYKGLEYFDYKGEDPKYFYGRTALTDALIEEVREGNFLAVLGPSGSGKSSVVRAGLLYQLELGQRLSGSDQWSVRIFRPDRHPLKSLASAFLSPDLSDIKRAKELKDAEELMNEGADGLKYLVAVKAGEGRLVLVIDQFEEVFTLCSDNKERQQFFECLLGALKLTEDNKLCLIITMRADFFGKCSEQEYAGLSNYIQSNLVTIIPMTQDELRQAIIEPAKKAGLEIEPELVTKMMEDVKDSPGSLPLLQYALKELWEKRVTNRLSLSYYIRMGGVKEMLAKRADEVFMDLSPDEQPVARRIFLELVQLGEGTEDTRRRISKQNLIASPQSEELVNRVIKKLTDEKLIVTSEVMERGTERKAEVDIAHEALIRHWPKLREWIDKNREDIKFQRRLEDAAQHWENNKTPDGKRPDGLLWRSPDLDLLQDFYGRKGQEMSNVVKEFYKASVELKEKEEAEKEEIRQRELEYAHNLAEEQRKRAEEQEMANRNLQSLLAKNYWFNAVNAKENNDCLRSSHFFARAGKEGYDDLLKKNCLLNIHACIKSILVDQLSHDAGIIGLKLSRDESLILTRSDDGTARLWHTNDGTAASQLMKHEGPVWGVAFGRDDHLILTWSSDGTARLWRTNDGAPATFTCPFMHCGKTLTSLILPAPTCPSASAQAATKSTESSSEASSASRPATTAAKGEAKE